MKILEIISTHDAITFLCNERLSNDQYAFCMDFIKRHTLKIADTKQEDFIEQRILVHLKFLLALSFSRGIPLDRIAEDASQREFPFTQDDLNLRRNISLQVSKHFHTKAIYAYKKLI